MKDLELIKSSKFNGIECDIYSNEKDMFMTINQLAECLEYSNGRKGIENLISRNKYLKNNEFSVTLEMRATDGKIYNTRVFTEDGIYEVTMLAKTEKAKEFRAFIRKLLKSLRNGETKIIKPTNEQLELLQIKKQNAEARLKNAKVREARFLLEAVDKYKNVLAEQSVELLTINALEVINGKNTIEKPKLPDIKYYSATEVGNMFNCSSKVIGQLANANNLKTDEYGKNILSKSKYSSRQCPTFVYNDKAIAKFHEIIDVK